MTRPRRPRRASRRLPDVYKRQVLRLLTDSERQIVMLHALSGLKHREVADLLDIPQATAISRYNRALAKLRASMGGDGLD